MAKLMVSLLALSIAFFAFVNAAPQQGFGGFNQGHNQGQHGGFGQPGYFGGSPYGQGQHGQGHFGQGHGGGGYNQGHGGYYEQGGHHGHHGHGSHGHGRSSSSSSEGH